MVGFKVACLAATGVASQYAESMPIATSRNSSSAISDEPHYGNPNKHCQSDEEARTWGSHAVWCTTKVVDGGVDACPKDVPVGMTAHLFLNGKYCAHSCSTKSECGYPHDPAAICFAANGGKCAYAGESEEGCEQSDCMSGPGCFAMSGGWVAIGSSSGTQTVEVDVGVSKSYSVDHSETWGAQVTSSVESGFDFKYASAKQTVGGEVSTQISASYSQTFNMDIVVKRTFEFDQAGTLWQWQWQIGTVCGSASVLGMDLVLTDGAFDPPCCVPNWFANPAEPHGKCHPDGNGNVYDLCAANSEGPVV